MHTIHAAASSPARRYLKHLYQSARDRVAACMSPSQCSQSATKQQEPQALGTLYYQPIVDAHTFAVDKLAVQPRWRRLSTAHHAARAVDAGCWVAENSLRQAAQWRAQGHAVPTMCIGVSATQLASPVYREHLVGAAEAHGIAPQRVEVELTSASEIDNSDTGVIAALRDLQERGFLLAFGDVGRGLASLSLLEQCRFSSLKMGRKLFGEVDYGEGRHAMVEAVIVLAHSFGLRVVASDVETEQQQEFLIDAGCDLLQGYLHGEPAPA